MTLKAPLGEGLDLVMSGTMCNVMMPLEVARRAEKMCPPFLPREQKGLGW